MISPKAGGPGASPKSATDRHGHSAAAVTPEGSASTLDQVAKDVEASISEGRRDIYRIHAKALEYQKLGGENAKALLARTARYGLEVHTAEGYYPGAYDWAEIYKAHEGKNADELLRVTAEKGFKSETERAATNPLYGGGISDPTIFLWAVRLHTHGGENAEAHLKEAAYRVVQSRLEMGEVNEAYRLALRYEERGGKKAEDILLEIGSSLLGIRVNEGNVGAATDLTDRMSGWVPGIRDVFVKESTGAEVRAHLECGEVDEAHRLALGFETRTGMRATDLLLEAGSSLLRERLSRGQISAARDLTRKMSGLAPGIQDVLGRLLDA